VLDKYKGVLDCRTCDEQLRKERGHDSEGTVPFIIDGKRIFRCPIMLITPLTWEYIKAFNFYQKNILPNGGGFNQETRKYIQAMSIIENEVNRKQEEQANKNGK